MTAIPRRSPILTSGHSKDDARDAVNQIENNPRLAAKTPTSSADDGYDGEIRRDGSYIYVYTEGVGWGRASLSPF